MAAVERMTITLPHEMAAIVREAVREGGYASSSEVVHAALRDWQPKRALHPQGLETLRTDIERGMSDMAEGRIQDFDKTRIIARGRSPSTGC